MLLKIRSKFQRPENGYDPVSRSHASAYSESEFQKLDRKFLEKVCSHYGTPTGKKILDLGAGPGQYTVEFAKYGFKEAIWWDISANYKQVFLDRCRQEKITNFQCKMNYLDEVSGNFDSVFNRICWYYCMNDDQFMKKIYLAMKEGGKGVFVINTAEKVMRRYIQNDLRRVLYRLLSTINYIFGVKLTHVAPTETRIKRIFFSYPWKYIRLEVDNENLIFYVEK
jgi:ubiquinone/menaquinone biosynthesis C-methylase UbiE